VHAVPDQLLLALTLKALTEGREQEAFYLPCTGASAEEVIGEIASGGASKLTIATASNARASKIRMVETIVGQAHRPVGDAAAQPDRVVVCLGRSSRPACCVSYAL